MTDHSEFPWGPQYEPGLLTPFGVIGWIVAGVLLLLLAARTFNPPERKGADAVLEEIHKNILLAAQAALKQDEYGILKGAKDLRAMITHSLGGLSAAGGALKKHEKALAEAMGEKDEKKDAKGHGAAAGGHGGHGGGHGAGHGAAAGHGASHGAAGGSAGGVPGVAANTVQGHSITVNVGGAGDHEGEHGPEEEPPLSLEAQLALLRKTVRDFETWWSNKQARIHDLKAARKAFLQPDKLPTALAAVIEEKKHH